MLSNSRIHAFCSKATHLAKRLAHTRLAITAWRIAILSIALQLCTLLYYCYNADIIGSVHPDETWSLFNGSLFFGNISVVYTLSLFLLLSIFPVSQRVWQGKLYRRVMFACYIIPAALFLLAPNMGDVVYFHYTHKRCTAEELFFADNSNTLELVLVFMWENWYLVVAYIALTALVAWGYRIGYRTENFVSVPRDADGRCVWRDNGRTIVGAAVSHIVYMLIVAVYVLGSVRGGYSLLSRPPVMASAMLYTTSPTKANMILSNPFCILRTLTGHVTEHHYFDDKTLNDIYTPSHYPDDYHSEMFGRYEGYNVVVFILESFSAEHSALLMPDVHPDGGYTPHLDSLMRRGLCFTQCYANGATSRGAPPAVWSSIPSYDVIFMRMSESMAECSAMPRLLADKGYQTAFFCGSEPNSMGFGAYAHIAGIEQLYSMEEYAERHSYDDYDGNWGIWDEPFIDYVGEELSTFEEPFFASVITITSHHPFNVPEAAADELPKGTTLAHRPVAYTDRAIGRFMERYKDEPWFDHTLFVFIGDHVSSERILERTNHTPGRFHVIGAIYVPDGSLAQRYDDVFSQVDVMPTVLGLVGNNEPYFAIGRDIFNEPERDAFTLIYTGFSYSGICNDYVLEFDGERRLGSYRHDDFEQQHDISHEVDAYHTDSLVRAVMQHYSTHVKEMNFKPDKR